MLLGEELRRRPISTTGTFGKVKKHAYTRSSPYWKHFAVKHDENDELRIHCNYCTATYKNEGTSNMKNHMIGKHAELLLLNPPPKLIHQHFKSKPSFVSNVTLLSI